MNKSFKIKIDESGLYLTVVILENDDQKIIICYDFYENIIEYIFEFKEYMIICNTDFEGQFKGIDSFVLHKKHNFPIFHNFE